MVIPQFLSGQALLAFPGINDPRFEHSVIFVCDHDDHGAMGIGINEIITDLGFHDLLDQFGIDPGLAPNVPVFAGGFAEPNRGFILHGLDWRSKDTLDICGRYGLTGTTEILRAIAAGRGPELWLAAFGYSKWGPGQLEVDISGQNWFPTELIQDMIFSPPEHDLWRLGFRNAGVDPSKLSTRGGWV